MDFSKYNLEIRHGICCKEIIRHIIIYPCVTFSNKEENKAA